MNTPWKNYLETMTKELGSEGATEFIESLMRVSSGSVENAVSFFYHLGTTWAPIIRLWGEWVLVRASYKTIALILRDAKPLQEFSASGTWKKMYLNRKNCGIPDEISGDNEHAYHPLLTKYLDQNECTDGFTFVDSGYYGTIVRELHELGFKFQPLFFFSKNPHIPGFLNELGITEKEGEILNDSLECAFPNVYERPKDIVEKNGNISIPLSPTDTLSILFGKTALHGVRDCIRKPVGNAFKETSKLLALSEQARTGIFTGVLASSSPEWSGKKDFLESWPSDLSWI